jgi:hypothetical protein
MKRLMEIKKSTNADRAKAPLPENFDNIALGRKEREKVISRGENPYRREGERVGQEMLDIDGNIRDVFE